MTGGLITEPGVLSNTSIPTADIPIYQLSIDINQPAQYHYDLAKQLVTLRKKGVLIIGSGNMVHNLKLMDWKKLDHDEFGFDWAIEMNESFKNHISAGNDNQLIDYQDLGQRGPIGHSLRRSLFTLDLYFGAAFIGG